MVAVFAFVDTKWSIQVVVVFSNFGGDFGFFFGGIANLVGFSDPTTFGLVGPEILVFLSCHILDIIA